MTYYSRVGYPTMIFDPDEKLLTEFKMLAFPYKRYWLRGESIGGFVLPRNEYLEKGALFEKYNLWENNSGIAIAGIEKSIRLDNKIGNHYASKDPIFVGDFIDKKQVLSVYGERSYPYERWECMINFGVPAYRTLTDATTSNLYHDEVSDIPKMVVDLIKVAVSGSTAGEFTVVYPSLIPPKKSITDELANAQSKKLKGLQY